MTEKKTINKHVFCKNYTCFRIFSQCIQTTNTFNIKFCGGRFLTTTIVYTIEI